MIKTVIMVIAILGVFAVFVGFIYSMVSFIATLIKKGYDDKKKRLTPDEIIKFCDETINEIINNTRIDGKYLCPYLCGYIFEIKKNQYTFFEIHNVNLHLFIPEFTNKNAVLHANGRKSSPHQTWWNGNLDKGGYDKENRILFLEWIRDQYVIIKEKRTPKVK